MDVYTVPFACGCAVLGIWLGLHAYAAYLSMSLRGIPGDDLFLIVRALRWVTDFHHRSYQLLIHKYHSHFVRLFLGARVVLVADAETYQRAFQVCQRCCTTGFSWRNFSVRPAGPGCVYSA